MIGWKHKAIRDAERIEKMADVTPDKTMMTEWAESSMEFSAAKKKFLDEFGFRNNNSIKYYIKLMFPKRYLDLCDTGGKIRYDQWPNSWKLNTDFITSIDLAKAILAASALLETNDIREIIRWANV